MLIRPDENRAGQQVRLVWNLVTGDLNILVTCPSSEALDLGERIRFSRIIERLLDLEYISCGKSYRWEVTPVGHGMASDIKTRELLAVVTYTTSYKRPDLVVIFGQSVPFDGTDVVCAIFKVRR